MSQSSPTSARSDGQNPAVAVAVLLLSACILGFAAILVKASELGPQATGFWRLTLALPALGLWLWFETRREKVREVAEQDSPEPIAWRPIILAGLFFAGDLAFWHAGIKITTAANATLLANLTPIIVAIAAWILFGEKITRSFIIAGLLAMTGAVLLSLANIQFAPERLIGDVLSALTAVWYGAYLLAVRAARRAGAATMQVMFWSTAIAAPFLLLTTLAMGERLFPATAVGWIPLILLGVVVHVGGQGGIAFGLGRTPAALATLIILVQPVVAAAAGWVLFGEALLPLQWLGAALVLAGVYAAQRLRPANSTPAQDSAKP